MSGAKTFFFMLLMTVLLVGVGAAFDAMFGGGGAYLRIFFILSLAMNLFTYWFADTIVLKMHRAREVTPEEAPRLHAIVDRLVERAGLPKPKVCVMNVGIPNAFATGRNRTHSAVAVTIGLMEILSEEELEGVLAHELAHIKHYDMLLNVMIASVAGLISMLAWQARWGMLLGGRRDNNSHPAVAIIGLILIFLSPILAMIIRSMVSHQREFAADAGGAKICGNPLALASALRRIEARAHAFESPELAHQLGNEATAHMYFLNHFSLGRAARMFSTHPPTEERIERLEKMARA